MGLALALCLSSCSAVRGVFGSKNKDADAAPKFGVSKSATEGGAPDLASVPNTAPTPPSSKQEREKVVEGLIADREQARYTDQESRIAPINVRPLSEAAAAPDAQPAAPPGASAAPVQGVTRLQAEPGKGTTPTADQLAAQAEIPPPPPPPEDAAKPRFPSAAHSATAAVGPTSPAGAKGPDSGPRAYAALGVRSDGFRPLETYEKSTSTMMNRVASINFGINSRSLSPADRRIVSDVVKLAKTGKETFRVVGRSNDASEAAQTRSTAVARELQAQGISQDRIFVGTDSGPEGHVDVIMDQ